MTILGIDPGYATVGYGVVTYIRNKFTPLQYGAITTDKDTDFPQRLSEIYTDVNTLIDVFKPQAVAVEQLFFNTNLKTGIAVSHARGVILLALQQKNIPIFEYTPLQVKQSVVGYGRAEKKQVMEMTRMMLNLDKVPKPDDAADALALAICHGHAAGSALSKWN